jgi:hypothetical protein
MDLENQARIKELADQYGPDKLVVILGGADGGAVAVNAETVTAGDPTYVGPLAGAQLGLRVYHSLEPDFKAAVDSSVYEEQIAMMEMVLPVEEIEETARRIRTESSKY